MNSLVGVGDRIVVALTNEERRQLERAYPMKPLPPRETAYPLGNLDALHAIRESYDELWVLGDIVNYGPEPREALEGSRRPSSSRGRRVCYLGGHCSACCLGVVKN